VLVKRRVAEARQLRYRRVRYGPALYHVSVKLVAPVGKLDGWDITVTPSLASMVISTRFAAKAGEPI